MRRFVPLCLLQTLLFSLHLSGAAAAATTSITVGLDTDANGATGCTLATAAGPQSGIERRVTISITTNTTTGSVGPVTIANCTGSTFGPESTIAAGPWGTGIGLGISAGDVIEAQVPLALLGNPSAVRIYTTTTTDALPPALVTLVPAAQPVYEIPAVSPAGLALLAALVAGALALMQRRARRSGGSLFAIALLVMTLAAVEAITLDGNPIDWAGDSPRATDPAGDAVPGQDLIALFAKPDGANLALRVDMKLALDPVSPAGNLPPVIALAATAVVTLPSNVLLSAGVTDDGKPAPPAAVTLAWSVVTKPAGSTVTFSGTTVANPGVLVDLPGSYVLQLAASDGALTSTAQTTLTAALAANVAPTLGPLGNRTVPVGTSLTLALPVNDPNPLESVSFTIVSGPPGASLSPSGSRNFRFTPTAAQIGTHPVTLEARDARGLTARASFTITVVAANRAPELGSLTDDSTSVGASYRKTLAATDPNGDPLTYSLAQGPAGLTLTGNVLAWTPGGAQLGTHVVKVGVADPSGATAAGMFRIVVGANSAPLAREDSYRVRLGTTLNVPAPGVLANDIDPDGEPLTARKTSDPALGTLTAFRADGSFDYTPPPTDPAPAFPPSLLWRRTVDNSAGTSGMPLAADFNNDGAPDILNILFGDIRAFSGRNGAQVWQLDLSDTTNVNVAGCNVFGAGHAAIGDAVGDGRKYIAMSMNCDDLRTAAADDRWVLIDGSTITPAGKVRAKWVTPRLSRPHPGAYANATDPAPANPPITPNYAAAFQGTPTLARLVPGGAPKLLARNLLPRDSGRYLTGGHTHQGFANSAPAACRTVTGLAADEGRPCRATFIIDGATGAIEQVLTAPNPSDESSIQRTSPWGQNAPIVADLDGDGQVEIISGSDVWKLAGSTWTLAWQTTFEPSAVAVADLDGDGKAEVIHAQVEYGNGRTDANRGLFIYAHDGTLVRRISFPGNSTLGFPVVADIDADGSPEILITSNGVLYAWRTDGRLAWAFAVPYIAHTANGRTHSADAPAQRTSGTGPTVYDLDGDGVPEIVFESSQRIWILNGRTGAVRHSFDTESGGYRSSIAMVLDFDADGHADLGVAAPEGWNCLSVTCEGSLLMLKGPNHWLPGPKILNQANFRPGSVNDAGAILYDASIRRDWRVPVQLGTVDPRVARRTSFGYQALDASGSASAASVLITIDPTNNPPVITSKPPTSLQSIPPYTPPGYTITAFDPDPGDTISYALVATNHPHPPGITVDATTGAMTFYTRPCGSLGGGRCEAGDYVFVVAAVDSRGGRTEQSFLLRISPDVVAVPNVVGALLGAARTTLQTVDLLGDVVAELNDPAPAGTVLSQSPAAATSMVARGTVLLTVSKGPAPVVVPNVVGRSEALATARLTALGFTPTVQRQFSATVPRGDVLAQSPAAGGETVPGAATLTVSSGAGLEILLAQSAQLAGQPVAFTVTAFDPSGNPTTTPPVTVSIAALGDTLGPVPVASANSIAIDATTRGAFRVTVTETGGSRRGSADLTVLNTLAEGQTTQQPLVEVTSVLAQGELLLPGLEAARLRNDAPAVRAGLRQLVTLWRTLDLERVSYALPVSPEGGFPLTVSQLAAVGVTQTADDVLARDTLRAMVAKLNEIKDTLAQNPGSLSQFNQEVAELGVLAQALAELSPGVYGVLDAEGEYTEVMTRLLPEVMRTFTDAVGVLVGLPPPDAKAFSKAKPVIRKFTLADVMSAQSAMNVVWKITNKVYKPALIHTARSVAVIAARNFLQSYLGADDLVAIISGASQSFHAFSIPGSTIEVAGITKLYGPLTEVWLVGPDQFAALEAAVGAKFKEWRGPKKPKNREDYNKQREELRKKAKDKFKELNKVFDPRQFDPSSVEDLCVFEFTAPCGSLVFDKGFKAVHTCSLSQICLPTAVLVVVWSPLEAVFATDAYSFVPQYKCVELFPGGPRAPGTPPGCLME